MTEQIVVGVMGPGESATERDKAIAREAGKILASLNFVTLTGGRNKGVMDAALEGAKQAKGLTVGVLPGEESTGMSKHVQIPIFTGLGNARNAVNVLSSKIVVVIGQGPGTFSEIALAVKLKKPIIAYNLSSEAIQFFQQLSPEKMVVMRKFVPDDFKRTLIDLVSET